MSKFEFSSFSGGYGEFAVNAQKYTKEEAIKIFIYETDGNVGDGLKDYAIENGYVTHRAGIDEDGEPQVCWWLGYKEGKRSCPVWSFCPNYANRIWRNEHKNLLT